MAVETNAGPTGSGAKTATLLMWLDRALQERYKFDISRLGLAGLGHLQQIAQERLEPRDLLEDRFQRGLLAGGVIARGKRVFRLEPAWERKDRSDGSMPLNGRLCQARSARSERGESGLPPSPATLKLAAAPPQLPEEVQVL
jgi:hypothetical protein